MISLHKFAIHLLHKWGELRAVEIYELKFVISLHKFAIHLLHKWGELRAVEIYELKFVISLHKFAIHLLHKWGELRDERVYVIMDSNFIGVKGVADKMYRHFLNLPPEQTEEEKLYASIRDAEIQWKLAEGRFNEATDPDLIDFATYDIMAAKSRYEYLIKTAKKQMGL